MYKQSATLQSGHGYWNKPDSHKKKKNLQKQGATISFLYTNMSTL